MIQTLPSHALWLSRWPHSAHRTRPHLLDASPEATVKAKGKRRRGCDGRPAARVPAQPVPAHPTPGRSGRSCLPSREKSQRSLRYGRAGRVCAAIEGDDVGACTRRAICQRAELCPQHATVSLSPEQQKRPPLDGYQQVSLFRCHGSSQTHLHSE